MTMYGMIPAPVDIIAPPIVPAKKSSLQQSPQYDQNHGPVPRILVTSALQGIIAVRQTADVIPLVKLVHGMLGIAYAGIESINSKNYQTQNCL